MSWLVSSVPFICFIRGAEIGRDKEKSYYDKLFTYLASRTIQPLLTHIPLRHILKDYNSAIKPGWTIHLKGGRQLVRVDSTLGGHRPLDSKTVEAIKSKFKNWRAKFELCTAVPVNVSEQTALRSHVPSPLPNFCPTIRTMEDAQNRPVGKKEYPVIAPKSRRQRTMRKLQKLRFRRSLNQNRSWGSSGHDATTLYDMKLAKLRGNNRALAKALASQKIETQHWYNKVISLKAELQDAQELLRSGSTDNDAAIEKEVEQRLRVRHIYIFFFIYIFLIV
ncbi:uncharacterized protein LOC122258905 [Penaeus japonicus]|uniref:uncharacterized protein LOC122258905 n=1 Tax=Penaeus japonicus TaxID=27405 RepID=UPI001C7116B6|nr:uncharacterized protein LOC122258905 [Penaeus japonicus]